MTVSELVAKAEVDVAAPPERVWAALTETETRSAYLLGAQVTTTWEVGTSITWQGEYEGHPYQDTGTVLVYDEPRQLSTTHYSPLMGRPDEPENYHTIVYTLTPTDFGTHLVLTQDGNDSPEQAEQFSRNWTSMLDGLKAHVEHAGTAPHQP